MVDTKEEAMFAAMGVNTQHGKAAGVEDLKLAIAVIKESSCADHFKKNPFAWDSQKLRAVLKCSPRILREAIVDTTNLMKAERDTKIRELWEQGLSNREIGREIGINHMTVGDVVNSFKTEQLEEKDDNVKTFHQETSPTNENTTTETEYEDSVFEDDRIT